MPESLVNVEMIPQQSHDIEEFLREGKIFQGGNAQFLHKLLSLTSGNRLLYVGIHLLRRATLKANSWLADVPYYS